MVTFLSQVLGPTAVYAITGAENMPEYRSFEPVATTNMVNLFDGSFTYNIPLMEVPNGYPISLSYHSNEINNESLASWVGLGWSINPGTINRLKRGYPDEFKGEVVKYHNRMPANWTISGAVAVQPEVFGNEELLDLNLGASIRYNNYNGIGTALTGGLGFAGVASLNFSYSQGRMGFNPEVNPGEILNAASRIKDRKLRKTASTDFAEADKEGDEEGKKKVIAALVASNFEKNKKENDRRNNANKPQIGMSFGGVSASLGKRHGNQFSAIVNTPVSYPVTLTKYSGLMVAIKAQAGLNVLSVPVDGEASLEGTFTRQKNQEDVELDVYGYMHSDLAVYGNEDAMMDYFTENEKPFEKRDNMIGYPIPNNDVYTLTGEALGGTFRPFRSDYGHYRKNFVQSSDISVSVGVDFNMASIWATLPPPPLGISNTTTTAGFDVGGDYHITNIGDWKDRGDANGIQFASSTSFPNSDEKFFFRFSGDKAGFFDLSEFNDAPFSAELDKGLLHATPDFGAWTGKTRVDYRDGVRQESDPVLQKQKRRSTYILHHLNSEFGHTADGVKYKVYEKDTRVVNSSKAQQPYDHTQYSGDGIGELVTYNNDGVTYVYGLPVYSRNQKELQYSLDIEGGQIENGLNDPAIGGMIAHVKASEKLAVEEGAKRKLGFESDQEFATTYLLTQILSPDYVDRTGNGPTSDDFGSFTKFNYARVAGGGDDWYSYRSPYSGVHFNMGSLSSADDDMGSFSYGEKEIYYLHSIVSKTHVAIFKTGIREDGLSAPLGSHPSDNTETTDDKSKVLYGDDGTPAMSLRKLERIDLYAIKDCDPMASEDIGMWEPKNDALPIKTVHFAYSYDLCRNVPNNTGNNAGFEHPLVAGSDANDKKGKLTLHKVWFEYGGRLTSKISPYLFRYEYPQSDATGLDNSIQPYPEPYVADEYDPGSNPAGIKNYGHWAGRDENPAYAPVNSDRWGNYRSLSDVQANLDAAEPQKLSRFWPFVNQNPDYTTFDPAAWCLKRITLPSGGEIHVQYEQNDYQFVQDKRAMVMVPLASSTDDDESNSKVNRKKYYLNLAKIGIDWNTVNSSAKPQLVHELFQPMEVGDERIFFNFLYSIRGTLDVDYRKLRCEYIEGYARIDYIGYDAGGVFFTFKGEPAIATYARSLDYETKASKREIPRKVCRSFYKSQRRGRVSADGSNANELEDANNNGAKGEDMLYGLESVINSLDKIGNTCKLFDPEMSYVRVQVPAIKGFDNKGKLGGGVRVKRLLMYDDGMVQNDPRALYGQEYTYKTNLVPGDARSAVISSGVATNEPGNGRRENALVGPIEKDAQTKGEAILFGRDMYSQEGPLGEALLPAASVGYSKVTVATIHKGVTGTGSEVHEFNTVRDFPFQALKTTVDHIFKQPISFSAPLGGVNVSYTRRTPYLAQGYSFRSFSMHGTPKSITKYAQTRENSADTIVVAQEYYKYFSVGDDVQVMGNDLLVKTVPYEALGKESEVLSEMRRVFDFTVGGNFGKDFSTGGMWILAPGPTPVPIFFPTILETSLSGGGFVNEQIYRTHVTTKIINYPALLKEKINITDGVRQVTRNIIFDDNSGEPVVTKSFDDFTEGTYLGQDFLASWHYENMRSKASNENLAINYSVADRPTYTQTGQERDLLTFPPADGDCGALADFVRGDLIELANNGSTPTSSALFHVDEVDYANNVLYVIPSQLNDFGLSSGVVNSIRNIRSGNTNQLSTKMGNIMVFSKDGTGDPFIGSSKLDPNNPFAYALSNNSLMNSFDGTSPVVVSLTGPFDGMSASTYTSLIMANSVVQSTCGNLDVSDVTITEVTLRVELVNGVMQMTVLSFTFQCGGTPVTIDTC